MNAEVSQETTAGARLDLSARIAALETNFEQLKTKRLEAEQVIAAEEEAIQELLRQVAAKREAIASAKSTVTDIEARFSIIADVVNLDRVVSVEGSIAERTLQPTVPPDAPSEPDSERAPSPSSVEPVPSLVFEPEELESAAIAEPEPAPATELSAATGPAEPQRPARPAGQPRPRVAKRSAKTVPERVADVMGEGIWDAGSLAEVLSQSGESLKSGNLRTYISNVLNSTKIHVQGPDGMDLRKPDGEFVQVKKFVAVERGKYRVATPDEIQREVQSILGAEAEVAEVDSQSQPCTPADVMFKEQGIDIGPVVNAQH